MSAATELMTLGGLSKQCWLSKHEQKRFRDIVLKWKAENPKADTVKQMLFESLVRVHLFEQRLIDKRLFFDGTETDYRVISGRKTADLTDEDAKRKAQELREWFPQVIRWKEALLKIAMASKIEITGADFDIAQVVKEWQSTNGDSSNNGNNKCGGCRSS